VAFSARLYFCTMPPVALPTRHLLAGAIVAANFAIPVRFRASAPDRSVRGVS
jgi:hypothetical protein